MEVTASLTPAMSRDILRGADEVGKGGDLHFVNAFGRTVFVAMGAAFLLWQGRQGASLWVAGAVAGAWLIFDLVWAALWAHRKARRAQPRHSFTVRLEGDGIHVESPRARMHLLPAPGWQFVVRGKAWILHSSRDDAILTLHEDLFTDAANRERFRQGLEKFASGPSV